MTTTFFLPGALSVSWTYDAVIKAYDAQLIDFNNPALFADPAATTIRHLAQFALDDIQRNAPDGDICIFGHSMGGYVMFELLRLMRETGFDTKRINGLAWLGSSAEGDSDEKKTQRMGQVADVNAGGWGKIVDTMLRALHGTGFMEKHPDIIERARKDLLDPTAAYDRIFVGEQYAMVSRPHYRNEGDLQKLPDCKILFIWGDEDKVVPDAVRGETRKACPTAYYVILPDAGHSLTIEAPAPLLKTLEQLYPR